MQPNRIRVFAGLALIAALSCWTAQNSQGQDQEQGNEMQIKHVFVIALENHNWTQPNNNTGQTASAAGLRV